MVEVRDGRRQIVPLRNEIAWLLLLDERKLNRRIRRDLAKSRYFNFSRQYISFSLKQITKVDDETGDGGVTKSFRRYRVIKRRILEFPGRHVAAFLRANSADGGLTICRELDYCKKKAWINEKLGLLEQVSAERAWGLEQAADAIEENIPGGQELLKTTVEVFEEGTDWILDTVIPVSVLIKLFKYGLDDLCPCCKRCRGTGCVGKRECKNCLGDGMRHPFPG